MQLPAVMRLHRPCAREVPILFESPHSGRVYPADFGSSQPIERLRPAEDAHVDALLETAPGHGITVIEALFPRAYIDVNRELCDLDPALLAGPWPEPLNPGPKTALGIGLVRRLVTPGVPIYDRRLEVAEVRRRIDAYWRPYRQCVDALVVELAARHGWLLVVQWHSMKSKGNEATPDGPGATRPDVVLGNRYHRSAERHVTECVGRLFEKHGLTVAYNAPYAGTPILERIAGLAPGVQAIQVELNRSLYLDEATAVPHAGMDALRQIVTDVAASLARGA